MNGAEQHTLGLVGQARAEQALLHAWQSGRLPHAWLLTGPSGVGKATLADRFAWTVLAEPGAGLPATPFPSGAHADLLVIGRAMDERRPRDAADIVVDQVRSISLFLHRTAARGGWRVVLVDGADRLNRQAANAMLKLIEEPPSRVLILLVCDSPGRLPPTLRSRCRTLRLGPLDDAAMDEILADLLPHLAAAERAALRALSNGSPGRAVALAEDDAAALSALVEQVLATTEGTGDLASYEVADAVLRQERGFATFLDLLSASISSRIRLALRSGAATDLLQIKPADRWAGICADLIRLRDDAERFNLDKRQAVLACLSLLGGP